MNRPSQPEPTEPTAAEQSVADAADAAEGTAGSADRRQSESASALSRRSFVGGALGGALVGAVGGVALARVTPLGRTARRVAARSVPAARPVSVPTSTTTLPPRSGPTWQMGASEIAERIRTGEVSSREVIDEHLARIAEVNGSVNAVTVVLEETARAAADHADKQRARGTTVGPLHGVPFTVKENIDLIGTATTWGLSAFQKLLPTHDAPHIVQLKRAGAIPIARTNLPDLAFRWSTDNALHGPTTNPWDRSRTAGGSSGGDAVALATGMTPLGMGNDVFGSLRVPAQFCGVTSLRPTLGRIAQVSDTHVELPIGFQLMAVQGPLARHVADLRLAFASMSGDDARDPWWTPAPFNGRPLPKRVAVHTEGASPQVAAGIAKAADAMSDAGYDVKELTAPMIEQAADIAQDIIASDSQVLVDPVRPFISQDGLNFIDTWIGLRPSLDKAAYVQALTNRLVIARAWDEFQLHHPLILGPVSTKPPFVVGRDLEGHAAIAELFDTMRFVVVVNLLGLPSVTVPVGVSNGLPQAVQLIGPRYREDLCLNAAEAIEHKLGSITPINPR